jgi:hypothetical protein
MLTVSCKSEAGAGFGLFGLFGLCGQFAHPHGAFRGPEAHLIRNAPAGNKPTKPTKEGLI